MKKIIFILAIGLYAIGISKANVEKKLDNIIHHENIRVSQQTKSNIDSLDLLVGSLRSDTITMDDLQPMQPGSNWLKNNWEWLLTVLIFLLEVFLRVAPTNKDWSIVNKILSILIWIFNIIPNNAKDRDKILKRGHDLKLKKIIDGYRNK